MLNFGYLFIHLFVLLQKTLVLLRVSIDTPLFINIFIFYLRFVLFFPKESRYRIEYD